MTAGPLKVLALSDMIVPFVYSPQVRHRFREVDLVLGCGDLPYYYLEYVLNALDVPLFYVRGNHDKTVEYSSEGQRTGPNGAVNLHRRVWNHRGILLAGVEGCLRYRPGMYQYSQAQMWTHVFRLVPGLLNNRLSYGRFLDVLVTHAPSYGIHDQDDLPHQGIKAFRWLLRVFRPAYHFHGHVHVYRPDTTVHTLFGWTNVINAYGFQEIALECGPSYQSANLKKRPRFW